MIDIQEQLGRLKAESMGVPYVPPSIPVLEPEIVVPVTQTAPAFADVEAMIAAAVRPLQHELKELHDINRRLLTMIQDVSVQMRHVREEVRDLLAQPAQPKPIDSGQTLPGVADITRLELQLFNNVAAKAKRKALGKSGRGTPNFKLKLNAWTCPKSEIRKHRNGTCGDFYMTMLPPGRALVKQLGHALDYLDADDAKFVGCLGGTSKFSKKRVVEQAAIIMPDNRLFVQIDDQRIDCGLPQMAHDDFAEGAHACRWHFPEING
jgi:hypothetical protein